MSSEDRDRSILPVQCNVAHDVSFRLMSLMMLCFDSIIECYVQSYSIFRWDIAVPPWNNER